MAEQQAQPAGRLSGSNPAGYRVRIESTGEAFDCPADRTLLDAAILADIPLPSSCRGGRCGSCRGRVLEGRVVYPNGRPDALDDADLAAGYALFCSAYARSDLTIALLEPDFG